MFAEEQAGFRVGRGCVQQALVLLTLQQKAQREGKPLFAAFLDLTKAFDSIPHEVVLDRAIKKGMPLLMVHALMLLLDGLKSRLLDTAHATAEATDARWSCTFGTVRHHAWLATGWCAVAAAVSAVLRRQVR